MAQLGTENIEQALMATIAFGEQYAEIMEDGKFEKMEGFKFIDELMAIPGIITNGQNIVAQFNDLEEDEIEKIKEKAKAEFDIANDDIETKIEKAFAFIAAGVAFFLAFKRKPKP